VIDDALVLRVERLRDEVELLRDGIRHRYRAGNRQVVAAEVRDLAAQLGERWVVEIAPRDDVRQVVGENIVGDLNIEFQRLITYSEQASQRARYEGCIRNILRDFRNRVVVPLKQARYKAVNAAPQVVVPATPVAQPKTSSVFIGQSFTDADAEINSAVARLVEAWGFTVVTGEKPKADTVSKKVRDRIEGATFFLGIFTRRDRIRGRT
jgi:hypothetical protein